MTRARLFRNGHSQAVRLPRGFTFAGSEVLIRRVGNGVLLLPATDPWGGLEEALASFSEDFMEERPQPLFDAREPL